MRVLVTGASGFVGRALTARIHSTSGLEARAAYRRTLLDIPAGVPSVRLGDLLDDADWTAALSGCSAVVHTAARVHVMREVAPDPLAEFRRVNVDGSLRLARQAAHSGVKRFVFLSSIKVNGEETAPGCPFEPDDTPAPVDPYGVSKREAEDALWDLASKTGMEVVVIRPVLVYGPGVKGNFFSMLRWLNLGIPLPLGAICNRRSFVALDNLVDLTVRALCHPAAANQTFLVSDGVDLSTPELLRKMGAALGKRARLVAVPEPLLKQAARLFGRGDLAVRVCGSLQVNIQKTRQLLDWTPPVTVAQALTRTAIHFLRHEAARSRPPQHPS